MNRLSCLLAMAMIIFTTQLKSQSELDERPDIFELSLEELMQIEVVSASRVAQRATDAPATVYVVTSQQIRSRNYSSLLELLSDIPQIEIQRKSYAEFSDIFTINGIAGNEKFLVLRDGIQINSITGTQHTLSESVFLSNVKQVEIILGPASSLYGADAFTGIINIITYTGEEQEGVYLSSSYGMFNTSNTTLAYGLSHNDLSVSISGKYYTSDEPFMPDFFPEEFEWYDRYQSTGEMMMFGNEIKPDMDIKPWATPTESYAVQTRVNFRNFEAGFSRSFESHSSSYGYTPNISIYAQEAVYAHHLQNAYASHNITFEDFNFTLNSTVSAQEFKLYPHSQFLNQYAAYLYGYKFERNQTIKLEEQFTFGLHERLNMVGGLSYEFLNAIPKTSDLPYEYDESKSPEDQNIHYPGTNLTDKDGNDLTIIQDIYNIDYTNFGSFIQLQAQLLDNMTLTAGARYDYNSRYKSTFNPRVGLVYKPTSKLHLKFLYGTAYLAPSPYAAYQHYGSFFPLSNDEGDITGLGSGFWHLPNPDLEPEQRQSFDTYAMYQLNRNLAFSVNGYYSLISNLIANDGFFDMSFHGVPVDFVSKAVNRGDATAYGGTVRVDYRDYILPTINLNYFLAYTYSDGEIEENPLIFSAQNTFKAGIDISYLSKFNIYTNILYRSPSHHRNSTADNPITNEAFTLLNVTANYLAIDRANFRGSVFIKVRNLLNQKYYNVGYENLLQTPQDPIRLDIGLKVDI